MAKEVDDNFSDDDSGSDQSDGMEMGHKMCDKVEIAEDNEEQEECNGMPLMKWNEKYCTTRHCISKEDMDKDPVMDMLKEWFGGNKPVILESWDH